MLTQMRTLTRGWVAYILLFLLVVAFAIWGINDAFNGVGSNNIAEVGGRKITPQQLSRELDIELRNQRNQGANVTQQDAIDAGFHIRLLDRLIARNALYSYADKLGVSVSDTAVANYIRAIPPAQNPVTGGFDQTAYNSLLQQLGFTGPEFEEIIRGDMTTEMLMNALVNGTRAPSSYGALLVAFQGETRTISVAEAPASVVGAIAAPTDAQVQTFYEENQEQLRLPEFRGLTLVRASVEDFISRVDVPEARLREEFDARATALTQPERRSYFRINATNEAQANDIVARLSRGEAPDAVAQALGVQVLRGENQLRNEVTDSAVANTVFEMQANAAPRVVRGQLTPFVVVRLQSITAAQAPNFAAIRDELRQAIAQDEAGEMLSAAIGVFEDARAGGASVTEAARTAGLPTTTIAAVEQGGRDQTGAPVEGVQEELLATAFETPEGEASDFLPYGDVDMVVAVDRIIPATVRPLAEVRDDLVREWTNRERITRMRALGAEMAAAVEGGQTLAEAARARGFRMAVTSRPFSREEAEQIPSRGLSTQIFTQPQGSVVSDIAGPGAGILVASIESINRVDLSANPQLIEQARTQVQQQVMQSVGEAVQQEITDRANPQRNERLLNQTFRSSTAQQEDAAQ
ncbi:MAG: SurA N-terminal domain-containing protein [Hyphomonadaceae bacterium JAD_PAG50586_4]|nr:MAG: SurA N-terminal domain-containing protein [Hyphomonadaceae bacterium JAD_PAG50586_4]